MKLTALAAILLAGVVSASGQGTINFANRVIGSLLAPIYGPEPGNPTLEKHGNTSLGNPVGAQTYGGPLLEGPGFTATLWARGSGTADAFALQATSPGFRLGTLAGTYTNVTAAINGVGPGAAAEYFVRVWDNRGGNVTSWAQVMADPTIARGQSVTLTSGLLGGVPPGGSPITPPNLVGMTSFNLFVPVPEPSLIALGALGIGALALRRFRK